MAEPTGPGTAAPPAGTGSSAPRDASNWAAKVDRLRVEARAGVRGTKVAGKRLTGPVQGFGKLQDLTPQGQRLIALLAADPPVPYAYGNTLLAGRAARLMAEQKPDTPRGTFRLFCTLLIPLDEDSRAGARLWAGLISRGCVDEPTRKLAALAYANLIDFVMRQLNDARPDVDAGQAARHLVSVIEGLRWPVLFGVYSEQQAMDVLDAQLDLIFGSAR